ncbi:MAG TPA: hypothetical protein VFI71_09845, partial [Pyrinomonadaceae bacterium]|nr:hypothetical protein [Pyrinomonadaceae bacterium]
FIISFFKLRKAIGLLGLLMPLLVRFGAWLLERIPSHDSISAYYYTSMRDVFVGVLAATGVFLFCYRGPERQDNILTNIAGLCAIGIALFPTEPIYHPLISERYNTTSLECYSNHGPLGFHIYAVAAFFLIISYLAICRFPLRSRPELTKQKLKRNWIYRICGVVMIVMLILIVVIKAIAPTKSIFLPETIAIVAFGVAWLVKGQAILKDKDVIAAA